jgi:N-acetyl-gamma-glutamylphosphate reductase
MAKSVSALWKKYSDAGAVDGKPPTPEDNKLRIKHVMDSIPYNVGHAHDHMEEITLQLGKLKKTDAKLSKKLGKQAAAKLHSIEQKVARSG